MRFFDPFAVFRPCIIYPRKIARQALEKTCAPVCQEIATHHLGGILHPGREDIPTLPPGQERWRDDRVFGEAKGTNDGSAHGHSLPVYWISIFAANTRALTASGDGTLKIWDLRTYTVRHTLSGGHGGAAVHCCATFANATRAISCGADNALRVWDLENTSLIGPPLQRHTAPVLVLAVGGQESSSTTPPAMSTESSSFPSSSSLSSSSPRGPSRNYLGLIPETDSMPSSTASTHQQSPLSSTATRANNTTTVFSGGSDGLICVWSVPSSARSWDAGGSALLVAVMAGHSGPVRCLSVFSGGLRLLSGSADTTVKVWDVSRSLSTSRDNCVATLRGHSAAVNCCSVLGSGKEHWPSSSTATTANNNLGADNNNNEGGGGVRCKRCGVVVHDSSSSALSSNVPGGGGGGGRGSGGGRRREAVVEESVVEAIERHMQLECTGGVGGARGGEGGGEGGRRGKRRDGSSGVSTGADPLTAARPDVLLALTGSADETLRVWDLSRGGEGAGVLLGHFESVTCCCFVSAHGPTTPPLSSDCLGAPPPPPPPLPLLGWGREKPKEAGQSGAAGGGGGEGEGCGDGCQRYALILSGSLDETLKVWQLPLPPMERSEEGGGDEQPNSRDSSSNYGANGVRTSVGGSSAEESSSRQGSGGRSGGDPGVVACRHTLSGHMAGVTSCAAFREGGGRSGGSGGMSLSGSFDRTIKVWDIPDK